MIERVLVIGGNSFTGSHLIDHVLGRTDCRVVSVSRSPEYDPVFLPYLYRKARSARIEFHQMDVNTRFEDLCALCDSFRPDAVFNYAAQGEVRNSWNWPEQWYETNCMAVVRLTEFLRKRDYLKRYVAISTPEVYGSTGLNVPENHNYHPSTPYAASKLAGDLHLFTLHKRYGFPVVFTRSANVYGRHQQLYRIIPRTVIYLRMGRTIELHGRGELMRSFIHARDVADLAWRAATAGRPGEVYHCSPREGLRAIGSVVRFICGITGHDFERSVRMVGESFGQDSCFSLDSSKARGELQWDDLTAFEDGVRETVKWIEDNWDFISRQPLDYVHRQ